MPIIPCQTKITCEGIDTPFSNFSSEAPDLFDFRAFAWTFWNPNFPLPPDLTGRDTGDLPIYWAEGCQTVCVSLTSQEEANVCARRQSYLCGRGNEGGDGVVPALFSNAAQTCSAICASGAPFSYTVPAGWFTTTSQSLSDQIARTYACAIANAQMICLSNLSQGCRNVAYAEFIAVTRGTGPFVFTLIGGTLPPGLTLAQFDSTSALLSGTPTTAGNFTFQVRARNSSGQQTARTYTVAILGITNFASAPTVTKGSAYSFQLAASGGTPPYVFSVAAGALPAGLTLSATGLISGTPTTAGTSSFVLEIHDATTGGARCQLVASLVTQNNAVCPTILTSFAVGSGRLAAYAPLTGEILHPNKIYATDNTANQFRYYDADSVTLLGTIPFGGVGWSPQSAAYAPGTDKLFMTVDDFGLGSWYIQIVNTATNVLGATIVDGASGALYGYYGMRYVSPLSKVLMLGSNGGSADTDALELNPATNAFTRFSVTVAPGGPSIEIATELDYCPDNGRYYVGTYVNDNLRSFLRSFNATTHVQQSAVDFGTDRINGVCWIADVSRLYVYTRNTGSGLAKVHVYNVTTDTVETVINLGNFGLSTSSRYWPNKGVLALPCGDTKIHFVDPVANTELCSLSQITNVDSFAIAGDNLWISGFGAALMNVYH